MVKLLLVPALVMLGCDQHTSNPVASRMPKQHWIGYENLGPYYRTDETLDWRMPSFYQENSYDPQH